MPTPQTSQKVSDDDFFYYYQDPTEKSEGEGGDTTDDSEIEIYFPADVHINVDEALVGLESLLDE